MYLQKKNQNPFKWHLFVFKTIINSNIYLLQICYCHFNPNDRIFYDNLITENMCINTQKRTHTYKLWKVWLREWTIYSQINEKNNKFFYKEDAIKFKTIWERVRKDHQVGKGRNMFVFKNDQELLKCIRQVY